MDKIEKFKNLLKEYDDRLVEMSQAFDQGEREKFGRAASEYRQAKENLLTFVTGLINEN